METFAEKVTRLQREIAERQRELHNLVLGDQSKCVSLPVESANPFPSLCDSGGELWDADEAS